MISVVIPTLNAQDALPDTLSALIPATVEGLVREVIIADGGSTDQTRELADGAGAEILRLNACRGAQLAAGAAMAKHPWLLFLHADTILAPGWEREVTNFIEAIELGRRQPAAAAFRFTLDDEGIAPRFLEMMVGLRCSALRLPYGDQGLLIPRGLYDEVGGFRDLPLMEDLDLVRRLGRRRVRLLRSHAITSAARYRRDGYLRRTFKNQMCLLLYALNFSPARILRLYEQQGADRSS